MSLYQSDEAKRAAKQPSTHELITAMMQAEPATWHTPTSLERLREASGDTWISSGSIRHVLQALHAAGLVERAETDFKKYDRPKYKYRWITTKEPS